MGDIQQPKKGAKIPESGLMFAGPVMHQELDLCQLVLVEGDCHGNCVELEAEPHHDLRWWRGFVGRLPQPQLG